jgi:uncharacterized protein (TIRG00374 family)
MILNKKKFLSDLLRLVLFFGLAVFFIWLSLRGLTKEDYDNIIQSAATVNNVRGWCFLSLSILLGAAAHFVRSLRSRLLLEPLHYNIRVSSAFYSVMVCYLANLALPRLGEVLRCTFLQRYESVPFQKSLGTIVAERALDLICWLLLVVVAIFINTKVLSQLVIDKVNNITLGDWFVLKFNALLHNYWLLLIVMGVVLLLFFTKKWWTKWGFYLKIRHIIVGIWQGLISIKDVKHPWLFVFYTVLLWVCYFGGAYVCFFAFDYLAGLGPGPAYSILAFGTFGFMIAQGGLGAYPLMVAGILLLYGVDYNAGLAAGWVGWSAQTAMVLIFGIISIILASLSSRKKSETVLND